MRASLALLVVMPLMPLMAPCLALNLVEMKPLAAAMLAKRWATDQAELDQKIGIRDDGVTGVLRFGDDLRRRTEVAKALDMWQKTSLALAGAAAKGGGSGATVCYAGMRDPGPNTLAMVKRSPDGWTLNFLLCNPNERDLDVIAAAERETLEALAAKAPALTPLGSVAATLVCDLEEVLS
jgi:hypothetical protein